MTHEALASVIEKADVALHELDGIRYLTYPALDELPRVTALTTLRESGKANESPDHFLGRIGPWLARALGAPDVCLAAGRQIHRDRHVVITPENMARPGELRRFDDTDALMTARPGVALIVLTADCLPIFLADPGACAVGLIHAGKVGTRKRIASQVADALFDKLGARPERTVALIGPSVGDGCYPQRLWEENVAQLRAAAVGRIVEPGLCTRCNLNEFYSYRAEKGFTGRMLSTIILSGA